MFRAQQSALSLEKIIKKGKVVKAAEGLMRQVDTSHQSLQVLCEAAIEAVNSVGEYQAVLGILRDLLKMVREC